MSTPSSTWPAAPSTQPRTPGPARTARTRWAQAVRADDGRVFAGVNLYHFTGGPCAELVALGSARAAGSTAITHIVAVGDHGRGPVGPCGRDRQVLLDYHPGVQRHPADERGRPQRHHRGPDAAGHRLVDRARIADALTSVTCVDGRMVRSVRPMVERAQARVVGAVVVEGAEELAVGEVGPAALRPGLAVWWASHQAAGTSQPSAGQVRSRMAIALRWAGEKRRRVRPRSRISHFPPRTTGMIVASQASRRARSAVIRSPVEVSANRHRSGSVEVEGHHHGVAVPPCWGSRSAGEVLQKRAERLAAATWPGSRSRSPTGAAG